MAGDDLTKTVEIVQGSWAKIVLQSAFYTACIGREWQLSLRFDARRAPGKRSWSPRDAPTATERGAAEIATGAIRAGRGRPTAG